MAKYGISTRRVVIISFLVNFIDIITNLLIALITGSAVIFAGLMQGISDLIGSLLLVIGDYRSSKPRDKTHPFGYGREVFFWTLLSAVFMLFIGSVVPIIRGYYDFISPQIIEYPLLAFAVLVLSVITNSYALLQSYRVVTKDGKSFIKSWKLSRNQLVKTAFFRDSLGTLAALFGLTALIIYRLTGDLHFDALGSIAIGILVLIFSLILITQSRQLITGESVPAELLDKIRRAVVSLPEIVTINSIYAVYSGVDRVSVDADIDIKDSLKTTEIEKLYDKVQAVVIKSVPEVKTVRINLNSSTDNIKTIA